MNADQRKRIREIREIRGQNETMIWRKEQIDSHGRTAGEAPYLERHLLV